ncbi:uncharacterized protein LOC114755373 [Neltuma alba]|uniref:uncharacterized protein LOC114755373 n=1 Tax=Neltuma alba TaxID=207710 RepID=UPI0010A4F10D|nr:uncharacterized protein LOC114755373 [Prosopis alba]
MNKERQAKNLYPHYLSRGGYKMLEERIMQDDFKAMQEAAKSDPSIVVQTPPPPPRHRKWKEARIKKGQYINPAVAEIAKKIEVLEEQSSEGSFSPSGRMDILATAIGKPDHPGRVRGEGRTVGLTQYFRQTSRASLRSQPTDEMIAKLRDQVRDELQSELEDSPVFPSTKDSCNPPGALGEHDPSSPTLDFGQPCCLRLEVPRMRVVVDALLYNQGSTIHHQHIQEDQVRVTVTTVREGETGADVPFPTAKVVKLGPGRC